MGLEWRSIRNRDRKEKRRLGGNVCCLVEMMLVIGLDSQLNLLIINQYMRNTLNTYDRNPGSKTNKYKILSQRAICARTSIILALIMLYLQAADCRETVLVESLRSKNDKIMLKMLEQTHEYIEFERYIDSRRFQCRTILKNDYTKNLPENHTRFNVSLTYGQVLTVNSKELLSGFSAEEQAEIKRLDKILDILKGQCLYYETITFIYEFCHKEHVRQFDTAFTKAYNIKPEFQDISMGLFNPEYHAARKTKRGERELTAEERKVTPPTRSDFSEEYNFLYVEAIDRKNGHVMQVEESQDGNLLYSNTHIALSDLYYTEETVIVEIGCQENLENNKKRQVKNYGLLVHPYIIAYTKKQGKCDKFISSQPAIEGIKYLEDNSTEPIRVFGKYLYGNVEERCTSNWAWTRPEGGQPNNQLEEGNLLLLQLYNERQKKLQIHYAIIEKVHNSELIELQYALGKSFKKMAGFDRYLSDSKENPLKLIKNITKCELLFKKSLNFTQLFKLNYLRKNYASIESPAVKNQGDNFGCLCKSIQRNNMKVVDFDVTIVKHLWKDHYQVITQSNTYIFQSEYYKGKEFILAECEEIICIPVVEKTQKTYNKQGKFTSVVKLTNKSPTLNINSSSILHFYILTIKNNGIIKLVTRKSDGTIYTYLLSEGQIIKMAEYSNGTKEIIKENKYYENSTQPESSLIKNFIYIKISKLPNGTYYGGIWKYKDLAIFPRFLLLDEELISFERVSGYTYLRILDLQNMKNKEALAIVKYLKKLEQHYSMHERLAEDPQTQLFLNSSYSISYQYVSGKYCDPPVNKFRTTKVQYKCGRSWFQITKLLQTSPCEYYISIETTLLCREGFKKVVEDEQGLVNPSEEDVVSDSGMFCYLSQGLFNQVAPYYYLQRSLQ